MHIIGSGMAGLLAAHYFRRRKPTVIEKSPSPVKNHDAVLRFRSTAVSDVTGIELQKVRVRKAIMEDNGTLTQSGNLLHENLYSTKVTGYVTDRSIINLDTVDRYIPPIDFIERLHDGVNVKYGVEFNPAESTGQEEISTLPMPIWMPHLENAPQIDFLCKPIVTISCWVPRLDVHQTVYVPGNMHDAIMGCVYRVSAVGSVLIIECVLKNNNQEKWKDLIESQAENIFNFYCKKIFGTEMYNTGLVIKTMERGKILPLNKSVRRSIVQQITDQFGVYSLGRFALWRNIVLDDVVQDLHVIAQLKQSGAYSRRLHGIRKQADG